MGPTPGDSETAKLRELWDRVVRLVWADELVELGRVCHASALTEDLFDSVLAEILPGREHNDALYLVASRLMEAHSPLAGQRVRLELRSLYVGDCAAHRSVLTPLTRGEVSRDEFAERVELVAGAMRFLGLSDLVRDHPVNTWLYVRGAVMQLGEELVPGSKLAYLLSELAVAYQNLHGKRDLVRVAEAALGRLYLLTDLRDGGWIVGGGDAPASELLLENKAFRARRLVAEGDLDAALAAYVAILRDLRLLFGRMRSNGEYPVALLLTGVLCSLAGDYTSAKAVFDWSADSTIKPAVGHGALFVIKPSALATRADAVRAALVQAAGAEDRYRVALHFLELATGHDYDLELDLLADLRKAAGSRDWEAGFDASSTILTGLASKRHPVVPFTACEFESRLFRACYHARNDDLAAARAELEAGGSVLGRRAPDLLRVLGEDPERLLAATFDCKTPGGWPEPDDSELFDLLHDLVGNTV
ncbi:hypothetical protein [Urbifossiella limnaea]|uniref:Uncharacterized protein n=1 Tax=Urbifossiella limnaea TaxID=2528023 RepID=A0A517XWI5_9BACT|nr:hypothetical protein [Urbifossiella limnaea]QDU21876.1 hypothetical protein ETAA1_38490 [Urbifossiella limnaea]